MANMRPNCPLPNMPIVDPGKSSVMLITPGNFCCGIQFSLRA
jgi:hypothetical protein